MNLTALRTIRLSPTKTVLRGETFDVSDYLGARYLRVLAAKETPVEPEPSAAEAETPVEPAAAPPRRHRRHKSPA